MRSTRAAVVVLLVLGVVAAGCGGDDSGSDGDGGSTISKADFIKQADKICADGDAEIATASDELPAEPTQDDILGFVTDTLVPNIQGQHDDIADLGAPKGLEADVEDMLGSLQDSIDAIEDEPDLVLTEDNPFADVNAKAKALGLTDCGDDSAG